jgi:hypothetical protein
MNDEPKLIFNFLKGSHIIKIQIACVFHYIIIRLDNTIFKTMVIWFSLCMHHTGAFFKTGSHKNAIISIHNPFIHDL